MFLTTNLTNLHERLKIVLTRITTDLFLTTNLTKNTKGFNANYHKWA